MSFLLTANVPKADGCDKEKHDHIELRRWATDDHICIHLGDLRITVSDQALLEAVRKVAS